jgi:hypothetical protein
MADIRHPIVPKEYAGKWIAWDHSMTRIVAIGTSPAEALQVANQAGEADPILAAAPRGILLPLRYKLMRATRF